MVTFILGLFIKISMRYQDKCVNESEHLIAEVALGDDDVAKWRGEGGFGG